ncbi:MAG TPA: hypothetical protein VFW38_00710 [Solirubrobacteraceae bacterium]|nr:hypothetical protein [Solirubrobacteraceae bacterium]
MGPTAITRAVVVATSTFALLTPAATAATTATIPGTKIAVPASALPHAGSTGTVTERAASSSTPNGAQPGNVAPGAGSTPTTATPAGTTGAGAGAVGATGAATGTTGTTGVAPTSTAPGAPATLGVVRQPPAKHAKKGLSGLALVLAAIGALLVLASLVWAISRWLALQPRWTSSLLYSLREASYHASATWAEFSDWARIGR